MKRTTSFALAAALAVGSLALLAHAQTTKPSADASPATRPAADEVNPAAAAMVGKPAPDFTLQTLNGKAVKLSDLKGSVVVLDFWALWCLPCRAGLPHLDAAYQASKADGVRAFAVNLGDSRAKAQRFVDQTKLGVPVLLDADSAVGTLYGAPPIPLAVIIAKDGTVRQVETSGFDSEHPDAIAGHIAAALGK